MFGGVKLCFWTVHCTAYGLLTSRPNAVSPWGLGRGYRLGGNRGTHLYATAANPRDAACHVYTNGDVCLFNKDRRGLSSQKFHAGETEKVED